MNKKLIKIIILAVLTVAMTAGAFLVRGQFVKKRAGYVERQAQAESALAAVQSEYDSLDTAALDASAAEQSRLQEENAALTEENDRLTTENKDLAGQISDKQADYDAKAEDNAYYVAIYDSLKEGVEKVEGYMDGH